MLRDITVLITAAGNVYMPGTTECLTDNGERRVRLIGADINKDNTILEMCDTYYSVPRGDDPEYVDRLLNICKKENVDVLIPIMSVELIALAANRKRFEEIGTFVSVSSVKSLTIANDKLKLFNYLASSGIPCAKYASVHSVGELQRVVQSIGYPENKVCIKATNKSGSRGFRILDMARSRYNMFMNDKPSSVYTTLLDMIDILSEAAVFPELMVMEFLPGAEYSVDLIADKGKVLYSCCRKGINIDNGIMLDYEVVENHQIQSICREIVEKLELEGNIGFDIKEDKEGNPKIMECNPRVTAGISIFKEAGVNLPYLNVKRVLGEQLPKCTPRIGTVVKRRWREMYLRV